MTNNEPPNNVQPAAGSNLKEMFKAGLDDPFFRVIAGVVVVATAANYSIALFGDGTRTVIAVVLSLLFGVLALVLRVLMKNLDGPFVRGLCLVASGVIVAVFLVLIIFGVSALTICRPEMYARTIGLKACFEEPGSAVDQPRSRPFTPVPYVGPGIKFDAANQATKILVFYRKARQSDAEHLVGALRSAGFSSDAAESDLNEVIADSRGPGVSLIKTKAATRPRSSEILQIAQLAMPASAPSLTLYPSDSTLSRGDMQIDLF